MVFHVSPIVWFLCPEISRQRNAPCRVPSMAASRSGICEVGNACGPFKVIRGPLGRRLGHHGQPVTVTGLQHWTVGGPFGRTFGRTFGRSFFNRLVRSSPTPGQSHWRCSKHRQNMTECSAMFCQSSTISPKTSPSPPLQEHLLWLSAPYARFANCADHFSRESCQ